MRYYVKERPGGGAESRTAWIKARRDAESICESEGFRPLELVPEVDLRPEAGLAARLRRHIAVSRLWGKRLAPLGQGDTLFLQLPMLQNCLFLAGHLRRAGRRGVRIIALVHDLETLRLSADPHVGLRSRLRMHAEETSVLRRCDRIVVHNGRMLELMASRGMAREKLVPLGIFDYLMDEDSERAVSRRALPDDFRRMIVAGNLNPDKAGYVYALPPEAAVDLYGVGYAGGGDKNVRYRGAFAPEELPARLEGGFGLVWDGPSAETCSGIYGGYLRYNDPHKTSLYLAAGLPVVVWRQAALAELILDEGAGIAVDSIGEAAARLAAMTEDGYTRLMENAAALGARLRRGEFLRGALAACGEER